MKSAVFRADASPEIGVGHVMRCTYLAEKLVERGWECCLAGSATTIDFLNTGLSWPGRFLMLECSEESEAALIRENGGQAKWDLLVCDHYGRGLSFEAACRNWAHRIFVIDDLPTRKHDADYLLDQTYERDLAAYKGLLPDACEVLAGPEFALLGPDFSKFRAASIHRRRGRVEKIMVCVGGSNPHGILQKIVGAIGESKLGLKSDIVIGPMVEDTDQIVAEASTIDPAPTVHFNTGEMARLMAEADLAIGVAGTTSWERCCLGLPAMIMTSADNQKDIAAALSGAGACRLIGETAEITAAEIADHLLNMVSDPVSVRRMATVASGICDGAGAEKVAFILDQ